MAGLAAAQFLTRSGFYIRLFEKNRGLGGRMATRRVNDLQFDHGAQYFTATSARFRSIVAQWREAGHAAEWFDGAFVGTPGMTAPARALAEGLPVIFGSTVHWAAARWRRLVGVCHQRPYPDTVQWQILGRYTRSSGAASCTAGRVGRGSFAAARKSSLRAMLGADARFCRVSRLAG
jgi:phytoene dehydrogenase-like protein